MVDRSDSPPSQRAASRSSRLERGAEQRGPERGDATRQKLLLSAMEVFGRLGVEAASTRALALAAQVNLQAIPYYFGSKQGLYIAVAEHIGSMIGAHVAEPRQRIMRRLADVAASGAALTQADARQLLAEFLQTMAELFISPESELWARVLVREQMAPTEAFERVYGRVMQPMLEMVRGLVSVLLRADPASEQVRLRTISLMGSLMVFRVAHATVIRQMGWNTVGQREILALRTLARELVACLGPHEDMP
jgi:AcrR family transcriptional regulator